MHLDEKKSNQKKSSLLNLISFFLGTFNYTDWNDGRNATGHGLIQRERNIKKKILYNIFSFEISFPTKKTLKI